jgi:isoquinoline 1-oxidoreductase beta subunit
MTTSNALSRRDFLKVGSGAGASLVIGLYLPALDRLEAREVPSAPFKPNVWIEIDAAGAVTIWTARSEMGQGVRTAMPMIVAEELDADWETVRVVQADADSAFGNQFTTGSRSVYSGWMPLRRAGAAAREMLVTAAAVTWGVSPTECRARQGAVVHEASGRRLGYGELVAVASTLPVPEEPRLKDPSEFRIVGQRIPRLDTPAKVTGRAVFGIDVRVPGMLYAAVSRCPVSGGTVRRYDAEAARAISGVREVVEIDRGVAVVAENTWAAFKGKAALACEWDEGATAKWSDATITSAFAEAASGSGETMRSEGDVETAFARAATSIEAVYEVPYLAHATMEPMNCTAFVQADRCEIWAPTQGPQAAQRVVARLTGLPREAVTVHVTFLGGGFGRRGNTDFVEEAVQVSQQVGVPIQLVWTREDDIRHGRYRPATYNVLRGALDHRGTPIAWTHRLAAPDGPEWMITRGADDIQYAIPNVKVERMISEPGIPIAAWRGVAPSQNCFVVESFVDELANAAGLSPYRFRRELLTGRARAVLDLAADGAEWGKPRAAGRHQGIAFVKFGETYVAQVAEGTVAADGSVRVHRVVCAVDCGVVINPDTIEAQMEGAIVYGLSAALYGRISIEAGRVKEGNFDTYRVLSMSEMPQVEVHVVSSDEAPSGIGEPALPPIAPAVCNAIHAATGKRIRRLPIGRVV